MKYKIERTSSAAYQVEQPCDKAYRGDDDDDEFDNPQWYIDIDSLEDLQELREEVKCSLIVSKETIEIYDDYRE